MSSSTRGTQRSSASISTNIPAPPIPNPNPNQPPTPTSENATATDPNVGQPPLPPRVGTKRKSETSEVWAHFTRLKLPDGNPDPLHCKYNYCGDETVKCHIVRNGTSSQWAHARKCMVNHLYEPLDKSQKILNRDNITGAVTYHQFSQANMMFSEMIGLQSEIDNKIKDPSDLVLQRVAIGIKAKFDKFVNPLVPGFDIAQWWKINSSTYPTLSKLAKDILAIPCSTVASENAFSLGSRVVDPFRSSLTPQMVEALVCTNDWLRAEQPNFYKEPTTEELELYQALEELEREFAEAFGRKQSSSTPTVTTTPAPATTMPATSAASAASTSVAVS
ncbi:hypothetical protein M0R45_032946 [Rubus argutus]|uniref:HAT C-terminal dimerisation domain-containing protein n=1 Tax=Rubus argutus TaxID=59490 RepID=A0AAW1WJM3_RUBAR